MIKIGQKIKELPIADQKFQAYHQKKIKDITLNDFKNKWLILLFYPADFTFVCPTELEDAAKLYPQFQETKTEVISISTDTVYTHKAWHDTSPTINKINYPMLADPAAKLCKTFDTYLPEDGLSIRATFIIDPQGHLKVSHLHDNSIGRNCQEILRQLQAAQFVAKHGDQVCPANWTPGQQTLKPGLDLIGKL